MGKKQTGKDSFAKFVQEILPDKKIVRMAFADPLKDFCIEFLGLPYKSCYGNNFEKDQWVGVWGDFFNKDIAARYNKILIDNISGREVLQVVGTDVFRENFKDTFWIDLFRRKLGKLGSGVIVCITDVRFPNEFYMLKEELEAVTVRLFRNTGISKTSDSIIHKSETGIDAVPETEFTYVIDEEQNTSLKKLKIEITKILNLEGLLNFGEVI